MYDYVTVRETFRNLPMRTTEETGVPRYSIFPVKKVFLGDFHS